MKKNVLFITGCYPKENEAILVGQSLVMPQNAANVLSWRIIQGLDANMPDHFQVLTAPFVGYYPRQHKSAYIPNCAWSHNGTATDYQIGFLNIKGIETLQKSVKIANEIGRWYKESEKNRNVLVYSHYAGFMRAIGIAKRKHPDLNIICLITDMPEVSTKKDESLIDEIRHIPRSWMFFTTHKNMSYVDGYVYLADNMKNYVDNPNKPYVIVEGISDFDVVETEINVDMQDSETIKMVYTGTLHRKYGIVELIEAFQYLQKDNVELHFCGEGDAEEEIRELIKEKRNLFFYGVIPHDDAIRLQMSADILVNPRRNEGIYTSLSFPSKTMEYMRAGKPVICYHLDGIPSDYDRYLYYFNGNTPNEIAQNIRDLLGLGKEKLAEMGKANAEFVRNEKNPAKQVKKIVQLMK